MIAPEIATGEALTVAEAGLSAGEMPIGAVVFLGDRIIASAFTQERALRRRVVHADLLAMLAADDVLRFNKHRDTLLLAVTLEPCLMCLGAAITLGIDSVVYALESPNDGAVNLLDAWKPAVEQPFFKRPRHIQGGVRRKEAQSLFARYVVGDGPPSMREWCRELAEL